MKQDQWKVKKIHYFSAICLLMFADNVANSLQGILLSDYIDHYSLISTSQGMMSMFQSIGSVLICLAALIIAGRIRSSSFLIYSISALCIPVALITLKPPFFVLLVLYFFIGSGYISVSNFSTSLTSELYPGNSFAVGILHGVLGLGGLAAPLMLRQFRNRLSWNMVCAADAAILFAIAAYYLTARRICRPMLQEVESVKVGEKIKVKDVRSFLSHPCNLLLMISSIGYAGFQFGITTWIVRYAEKELHAASAGALMMSMFWVGTAVARLTITRLKIRPVITMGIGCLMAGVLVIFGVTCHSARVMVPLMLISGLCSGAAVPLFYYQGCQWYSGNSLLPTSILALSMCVAAMVFAPVTATVAAAGLSKGMICIAVYTVIGGLVMFPVIFRVVSEPDHS